MYFEQQSRDYGGGFLYGQPELFGSLGDGLLAARSEVLAAAASSGGSGVGSGNGSGDSIKSLRGVNDASGFLHGHVPSSVSASIQSAQNGRQQVRFSLSFLFLIPHQIRHARHAKCFISILSPF